MEKKELTAEQSETNRLAKNKKISETRIANKKRREDMTMLTMTLKINARGLKKGDKEYFDNSNLESKWIYNSGVRITKTTEDEKEIKNELYELSLVNNTVGVKMSDGEIDERYIRNLSSQMRLGIVENIQENLDSLKSLKRKGHKAGELKYKAFRKSIPLKEYGITYGFTENKLWLQGCKKTTCTEHKERVKEEFGASRRYFKVDGIDQLNDLLREGGEIATGEIITKASGYYISVNIYVPKKKKENNFSYDDKIVAIDPGVKNQLTTSTNKVFNFKVEPSEELIEAQKKLSKHDLIIKRDEIRKTDRFKEFCEELEETGNTRNRGLNDFKKWCKKKNVAYPFITLTHEQKSSAKRLIIIKKINKEYEKMKNKLKDIHNKILNYFSGFKTIIIQDEAIKTWMGPKKKGINRRVQYTAIGELLANVLKLDGPEIIIIDKYFASTQICSCCGNKQKMPLSKRVYKCEKCGFECDRDYNAALNLYQQYTGRRVPLERRDFKPTIVETGDILAGKMSKIINARVRNIPHSLSLNKSNSGNVCATRLIAKTNRTA